MACSTDLFQEHRVSYIFIFLFIFYRHEATIYPSTPVDGPLHLRTEPQYIVMHDMMQFPGAQGLDARGWYGLGMDCTVGATTGLFLPQPPPSFLGELEA